MDCKLFLSSVCPRPESNRHALRQLILSQSWLPLHHGGKGGTGQNVLIYGRVKMECGLFPLLPWPESNRH